MAACHPRSKSEKHRQSAKECHAAYVALVEACAEAAPTDALDAYLTFLRENTDAALEAPQIEDLKTGDLIAPRVDGKMLTDSEEVRAFWIDQQDREAAEKSELEAECMVCGEVRRGY